MTRTAIEYTWSFPAPGDSAFDLHLAGRRIGCLRFQRSACSTAEWEGRCWIFERQAAFDSPISIRAEGSADPTAVFADGTVRFASGGCYRWTREHLWSAGWCFRTLTDHPVICLSQHAGPLVEGGNCTVSPEAAESPETPPLVLLAWLLRILEFEKLSQSASLQG